MKYEIRFERKAEKELSKIPIFYQNQILLAVTQIAQNPFLGKKLAGEFKGAYSFRAWPYRIIYKIYKDVLVVVIIHIKHRQGAYK